MLLEYLDSIIELTAVLVALLICLFHYIDHKNRNTVYMIVILLCGLMCGYYWTNYLLIIGDTPEVSDLFYYSGWNIAYLLMLILVLRIKKPEERKYFHPLMLLPIPLNYWQLTLYLPYGGQLNSIYQVTVLTAVAVFSLQSVCRYVFKYHKEMRRPYIETAMLLSVFFSFGMWTTSSLDEPAADLYYLYSFLNSMGYLLFAWAVARTTKTQKESAEPSGDRRVRSVLKMVYLAAVIVCCIGGFFLAAWMKNVMSAASEGSMYRVITVVLYIISLFLAAFAVTIIIAVNLAEKVNQNNEYREATIIAENSNKAKNDFLANMSQELRMPIRSMLSMNENILRESLKAGSQLTEEQKELKAAFDDICTYAGNIENDGRGLLSTVNDILDYSCIEAGKLSLVNASYQLEDVLRDVCDKALPGARAKNLAFHVEVDRSLPRILLGDEMRVKQILTNLLDNAVTYTGEGSVRLAVRLDIPGNYHAGQTIHLVVTVEDTGIGIDPADMENLLMQSDRTRTQHGGSPDATVLGLVIAKRLAEAMAGTFDAKSSSGQGSIFTITIPQKVVSEEPMGDFRGRFEKSVQETDGGRGMQDNLELKPE